MERITIIDAGKKGINLGLKELFAYRDLFLILAFRDFRVRYAQTILGIGWAFIQPIVTLLIFMLVFGKAIKVDTEGIPYPLFALVGMTAWTYFSFVMNQSGSSIIGAQEMIKKVYFPRLVIPLSKALVGFVDFGITLVLMILLVVYYQIPLTLNILYFPVFFLCLVITALTVGIWLSALTIRYRDFQHIVPFLVQFGLYAAPVAYPATLIPEKYLFYYYLNPITGIIEGFRWCFLGSEFPEYYFFISMGVTLILFFTGMVYFRKTEKIMADLV